MVADLLAPGGVAVFTVDFSNRYRGNGRKPVADIRLYTTDDLRTRLMPAIPDCGLFDTPTWDDGDDDFEYEGSRYSFASWVFCKLEAQHVDQHLVGDQAHWKNMLRAEPEQMSGNITNRPTVKLANDSFAHPYRNYRPELASPAEQLRTLVHELRWPEGPRAVRVVLPLARLMRGLNRTRVSESLPDAAPVTMATTASVIGVSALPPVRQTYRQSMVLGMARLAYRLVRPMARVVVRRTRTLLPDDISDEIGRLDGMLQAHLGNQSISSPGMRTPITGKSEARTLQAELQRFEKMLEDTLLTLALDRDRR